MRKKWNELTETGKRKRIKEIRRIMNGECLTFDFWKAYDKREYDLARKILRHTIAYSKKLGYDYAKNNNVDELLT